MSRISIHLPQYMDETVARFRHEDVGGGEDQIEGYDTRAESFDDQHGTIAAT